MTSVISGSAVAESDQLAAVNRGGATGLVVPGEYLEVVITR